MRSNEEREVAAVRAEERDAIDWMEARLELAEGR